MDRETIVTLLKVYQFSEKKPEIISALTERFIAAINPRIKREFGVAAEIALRRVLKEMFAIPVRGQLCLDAVLYFCEAAAIQLCHEDEDQWEVDIAEDCSLIQRIRSETYFVSNIPATERSAVHQSNR